MLHTRRPAFSTLIRRLPKVALLLAAGSVAIAGLAGCPVGGGGGGAGAGGGGTAEAATEIVIGHYASMTGSEASFGVSTDNGIKLAVDEQNAKGGVKGKQVRLITYDDQGKSAEVTTVVTRLITSDKVTAILGEVASSRSIAGGQVAQRYGIPMITPSSTNPQVTDIGDRIFRVCFIDPFQGEVCAKFAIQKGWKRAATVYDRVQAYSTGLNENFKSAFTKLGGEIVEEQAYSGGDSDFGAQITTIKAANPDVIFVPGYYTDVGNLALQVRKAGLTQPFLGGDGWDSPDLVATAGAAMEGSFFSNHYSHEESREAVQTFVQKYQSKFGTVPDGLAALGYDAAMILFSAMEGAPSLSGADISAKLASTASYPGVTGSITMDAKRNATKSAVILGLHEGKWRYETTITP